MTKHKKKLCVIFYIPEGQKKSTEGCHPNPDIETKSLFPSGHCERVKGAWQFD
jgi:hypothetical protein